MMGELLNVTVSNNRAIVGGGVHIEHNPTELKFSEEYDLLWKCINCLLLLKVVSLIYI